jgi:transcriptional regulator with XRE-family HTH domain
MAAPQGKFYEELGRRVAAAREKRDLSQQKLAELLGLSRTSVTNIEKGRQPVDIHVLVRIANTLGVALLKLVPEESLFKKPENVVDIDKYEGDERRFIESILGSKSSSKKETK